MTSTQPPADRKSFRVAIVCALPREADAIILLFDQFWDEDPGRAGGDMNTYITGRIGKHHIVLVLLPNMGSGAAAAATSSLRSSYTNLTLAILVGICGGVPRIAGSDTFLGDVVVSKTVIQYRYGRQYDEHFAVKNTIDDNLGRANKDIRSLLAMLETEYMRRQLQKETYGHLRHLQEAAKKEQRQASYLYPGSKEDKLYSPTYAHRHREACGVCANDADVFCEPASKASCVEVGCDPANLVVRNRSEDLVRGADFKPKIFIGRIGSGDAVMKSGKNRDRIAMEHDLVAFEMEGAGAWDEVPCIVVKGICDYADSHKNKDWNDFAAATAASVAKAILGRYTAHDVDRDATRTE
ncbi:hypothetical protein QQS21_012306, partial [Conoideocrella luteorostrata]